MRKLTADEVEFTVECLNEDASIEGNCSSIDPKTDREQEEWIYNQLNSGNEWAWCSVKVTAKWKSYEAWDYLGCCSYLSREDFMHPDGYYPGMKTEALRSLNELVANAAAVLNELE